MSISASMIDLMSRVLTKCGGSGVGGGGWGCSTHMVSSSHQLQIEHPVEDVVAVRGRCHEAEDPQPLRLVTHADKQKGQQTH